MVEWPKDQHVATSWAIGYTGVRVGSNWIYEDEVEERRHEKGFRWRPKYLAHLKTLRDPPARSRSDEQSP